jgi:hypothetical protein
MRTADQQRYVDDEEDTLIKGLSNAYIDTLIRPILKRKNTTHALFFRAHFSFPCRAKRSVMGLLLMGYAVTFFCLSPLFGPCGTTKMTALYTLVVWLGCA